MAFIRKTGETFVDGNGIFIGDWIEGFIAKCWCFFMCIYAKCEGCGAIRLNFISHRAGKRVAWDFEYNQFQFEFWKSVSMDFFLEYCALSIYYSNVPIHNGSMEYNGEHRSQIKLDVYES